MVMKASIQLTIPIRIKRIANGERIIEQTGMDEYDVHIRETEDDGKDPIVELNQLLDEYEKERRRVKARVRRAKITAIPSFLNGGSKQVNGIGSGEGGEANKSPKVAGHRP